MDWYRRFSRGLAPRASLDSMFDGMMKRLSVMKIPVFPARIAAVSNQAMWDEAVAQPITESCEENRAHDIDPADTQGDCAAQDESLLESPADANKPDDVDSSAGQSAAMLKELVTQEDESNDAVAAALHQQSDEMNCSRLPRSSSSLPLTQHQSGLLGVLPEGPEEDSGSSDDLGWVDDEEKAAPAIVSAADKPVALNMEFISGIRDNATFEVTPAVRKVRDSCSDTAAPDLFWCHKPPLYCMNFHGVIWTAESL